MPLSALEGLNLFLPVVVANLLTYLAWLRFGIGLPLDLGATCNQRRIIGDGRSFGGLFLWISVSSIVGGFQGDALRGFYLGAGGISGTVANSMIKRRLGLEQGRSVFFLDYFDHILGAGLMLSSAYPLSFAVFAWALAIYGSLHLLIELIIRRRLEKPVLSGIRLD